MIRFKINAKGSTSDCRIALKTSAAALEACGVPENLGTAAAEALLILFSDARRLAYEIITEENGPVKMRISSPKCNEAMVQQLSDGLAETGGTSATLDGDSVCVSFEFEN